MLFSPVIPGIGTFLEEIEVLLVRHTVNCLLPLKSYQNLLYNNYTPQPLFHS